MGCCQNIYDLGRVQAINGKINTGILAQATGEHVLETRFLDIIITLKSIVLIGEEITFQADELNEAYEYTAQIYAPDKTQLSLTKGGTTYDCLSFEVVIVYDATPNP